jgi:transcription-repair coupling factor (superfamily II helicase)
VVVTEGFKTQENFFQDAQTWLATQSREANGSARLLFYPAWGILPHEAKLPHVDVISERLETLVAIRHHATGISPEVPFVVTTVAALLQRTFPADELAGRIRRLRRGDRIDPLDLVEWLEDQGYESEVQVNHKGEIALRGGIVDVFPLVSPWPVRIEFFGNEIESLRFFDPISQISREEIPEATIPPGGELGLVKKMAQASHPIVLATLLDYLPAETIFVLCEPLSLAEQAARYAEQVPAGDWFHVAWSQMREALAGSGVATVQLKESEAGDEISGSGTSETATSRVTLHLNSLDAFRPVVDRAPEPQVAEAQRREFFAQLHRWLRQNYAVHVFCNNEGERQRFSEIWEEYGLGYDPAGTIPSGDLPPLADRPTITMHLGTLTRGFIFDEAHTVVVTDAEIFGRYKIQRPRRLKSPHAQTSRSLLEIDFSDLEDGDYVVHLEHGIGRYLGLQRLPTSSGARGREKAALNQGEQECLVIEYAASDPAQDAPKLYVPVNEAHLISKYVGAGKARPPLNTLGGGKWARAKQQAQRAVRDLAAELLSIQAARESQAGHAFKADSPWQREFEGSFLYEETPDQLKAIHDTKTDMEGSKPMDRLICGDVGYGKTEVAIRAAFKAVMDGRQVAVLVPTTVLAQQHFNTFRERMADYPVRVELLSRFRTAREQQRVLRELAGGAVDIVIGTHRLVQDDVAFKELGLVVIDEEQRFGVLHKEKFKMLRQLVDVLTLSATPIPRTLHLALTGARDMSTIETPPQDRLPVETIVCEYDERVIRDAIQRELNRQGQVFYLHNRVLDIDTVAVRLRALVPHARLVVGHGQMHADELEEVMTRFVNGEADVLLSTTIIESGLDIPNANTIIIERADRFGLSDLYQLRGRVGRYKHQAYAYLLMPRHARLLTDARKRISAIKQYSTLGSGFKIAMRDLEIRGAGNLLGAQQSGHITAVGFDLYCQLLKQSVSALKGEKAPPRVEVQVRLDFLALNAAEEGQTPSREAKRGRDEKLAVAVPRETATCSEAEENPSSIETRPARVVRKAAAFVPLTYVSDSRLRIEVYRKLAEISDAQGVERLRAELDDRFSRPPPPVELLLQVAELKLLASQREITVIEARDDKLILTRHGDYVMVGGKFPRLTKKEPKARLNEIKRLIKALP